MLERIKAQNIFKKNSNYIFVKDPIDTKTYEDLYEQWHNPNHESWLKFRKKYNVTTHQQDSLDQVKDYTGYVGYWFFRQRTDNRNIFVCINDNRIKYQPNSILIVDAGTSFQIKNKGGSMPSMLCTIISFNFEDQSKIKALLDL